LVEISQIIDVTGDMLDQVDVFVLLTC
jgi:hypothetical protein